jgi:hypothetical protein
VGADGKTHTARVVQYLSYDVASGAIVGFAHSKKKDARLFEATLRNMFTTLDGCGLGMPMEVELEQHVAKEYFEKIRNMGTIVTECAPGNSQQKRAEHFNRVLKYTVERPLHGPEVGRFYGKHEAYQYDRDWKDNELVQKAYEYDRLVADAIHAINVYNSQEHPKHKGLSRWDVLMQNQNPKALPINWQLIARNLGEVTDTSLQRNYRLQVQYAQYRLPQPELLRKLIPNNDKVQAYYLRAADGTIPQVYVYQGDTFIATCERIDTYNEAVVERTAQDYTIMRQQWGATAQFNAMVKDKVAQLSPIVEVHTTAATIMPAEPVQVVTDVVENEEYDMGNLTFDGSAIENISKKGL